MTGASKRTRWGTRLAFAATLLTAWIGVGPVDGRTEEPDANAPPAVREYRGRGVYYVESRVASPLGALS